jgi:predicted nicotinamide N-methyase
MTQAPAALCKALGRPLELAAVPLCPELSLWLLSSGVDTDATCAELADLEQPPYWAFCWIGGQALARYLLDHPEEVRDKRVVDLGAGCGVASIAAARAGARCVTAVDVDPMALEASRANAELNGVSLERARALPGDWDVLLAADVLYDANARGVLREQLAAGRSRARARRARLLVSDPERAPEHRLAHLCEGGALLARVEARTYPDVDGPQRRAQVYAIAIP